MASSDSGRPKRAELLDVNINTGAQSINAERASAKRTRKSIQVNTTLPQNQNLRADLWRVAKRILLDPDCCLGLFNIKDPGP